MKQFLGQLDGWGVVELATYRKGKFKLICKTYKNTYFITFYNGRQTCVTRYTENKDEANALVLEQIKKYGYKKVK